MAIPPKSMKQGVYWVQKYLKKQRSGLKNSSPQTLNQADFDYNTLKDQCKKLEKQWLTLLDGIEMSKQDADAVDQNIFELRRLAKEYGVTSLLSEEDLRIFTLAFLNAAFNLIAACFKYKTKRPRNKTITWNNEERILYVSGKPYMTLKHGREVNSISIDIQPV